MSDIWKWRPIGEYDEGSFALLREGRQQVIGIRQGDGWAELLAGHRIAKPGFQPTEFTALHEEMVAEVLRR